MLLARRHVSLPALPILRRLGSRLSFISGVVVGGKRDSGSGGVQKKRQGHHRRNPSWIDEDALHGPATSLTCLGDNNTGGKKGKERRDSWYALHRSPTLPMLRRSQCGGGFEQHWEELMAKDVMSGAYPPPSPDSYTQVVMEARALPEPPKPAVVAGRDRQMSMVVPPTSTTTTNGGGGRLGHKYSNSEPPMRPTTTTGNGNGNINTSPVRSLPRTPTRARVRQASTDSTLSEILRSTEKRLQEGYVSSARLPRRSRTTGPGLGRSQWYGTSRESLLGGEHRYGVIEPLGTTIHRSRSESKASSGQKKVDFVGGHSRQESHTSTISSTSSIELTAINDFANSGLADYREEPEAEMSMLGFQSVRSSVSSALSTIQSEDEVSENVKHSSALTSPNANSRNGRGSLATLSESSDAFSSSSMQWSPGSAAAVPRPLTTYGKGKDLLWESLERSLRGSLLRAPVDQSTLLAEASRLPPLPAAPGGEKPHSFFRSDCSGCCKLGQTKTIPVRTCVGGSIPGSEAVELPNPSRGVLVAPSASARGPLGPRSLSTISTSLLNSIVLPPPPAAPQFAGIQFAGSSPPPSPTHRLSSRASANKMHRMSSVSSSVYSQDPKEISAPPPAILPMSANKTSFQANSHLSLPVPAPVPLQTVFKGSRNSADNTKLPKFTGFIAAKKEGKRVLSLDDSENDQENIDMTSSAECAITSTVAELRRMNSALSMTTSVATNDASDSRPDTPTTARLSTISGKNGGHRKSKSGNSDTASARKAYLSLGGTTTTTTSSSPASSPQKVRSMSTTVASRSGSPALRTRSRRESIVVPSFVAALESATTSPAATSSGSPIKKKRRTVVGTLTRSSPSPGVLLGRSISEEQHERYRFEEKTSTNRNDKTAGTSSKETTPRSLSVQTNHDNHNNKYAPAPVSAVTSTFTFPPVSAANFTFQVIPASSPTCSPTQSNPSTPTQRQYQTGSTSPSNNNRRSGHRRQNSSTDFRSLQWNQTTNPHPLTVAKHREQQLKTPSPQKGGGAFEMSGYAYSPGQSPPKTPTTPMPRMPQQMATMAMSPEAEGKKRNPFVIEPLNVRNSQQNLQPQTTMQNNQNLQIPIKSPRRREKLQQQQQREREQQQQRVTFEQQHQQEQQRKQQQQQAVSSPAKEFEITGVGAGSGVGVGMSTVPTRGDGFRKMSYGRTAPQDPQGQAAQGQKSQTTPTKTHPPGGMAQGQTPGTVNTVGRRSIESPGSLYDKDGFYISHSPLRATPLRHR
ncbi:hypothetical protein V8F06_003511 [Rhypophila decipiens]